MGLTTSARASYPASMDASELLALSKWLFLQEELPALLALVARNAVTLCTGERGFVVLHRENRLDLDGALASQHGGLLRGDIERAAPFALRALHHMQTTIETDPASGRPILCAPFASDEHQHGVIVLERSRGAAPFDAAAQRRAGKLASQVGIAVRVTQRFEDLRERCNQKGSLSSEGGPVRPIEDLEREAILNALKSTGNDKRLAAQLLGISRAKVYQRLKNWGLT